MNPANDGIDHINLYSKGKTELGRFLSNFTKSPIDLPEGTFASIEGYWYWLATDHPDKDKLRTLYGYQAKKVGRELGAPDWIDTEEFRQKIKHAIVLKLLANEKYHTQLVNTTVPFTHYYVYGDKVVDVPKAKWMLDFLEQLRTIPDDLSLEDYVSGVGSLKRG